MYDLTLVFDIDGTLDAESEDGAVLKGTIHAPIIPLISQCLQLGAHVVFMTNRTQAWVCKKLTVPVASACSRPSGRMFAGCEQASELVEYSFGECIAYRVIQTWPLRDRAVIDRCVRRAIHRGEFRGRRREGVRVQVCYEAETPPPPPVEQVAEWFPESIRESMRIRTTRSTVTIVSSEAGKDVGLRHLLEVVRDSSQRQAIGFGDDGDEFALLVPTLDVDRGKRSSFEKPGYKSAAAFPDGLKKLGLSHLCLKQPSEKDLYSGGGKATAAILSALLAGATP